MVPGLWPPAHGLWLEASAAPMSGLKRQQCPRELVGAVWGTFGSRFDCVGADAIIFGKMDCTGSQTALAPRCELEMDVAPSLCGQTSGACFPHTDHRLCTAKLYPAFCSLCPFLPLSSFLPLSFHPCIFPLFSASVVDAVIIFLRGTSNPDIDSGHQIPLPSLSRFQCHCADHSYLSLSTKKRDSFF